MPLTATAGEHQLVAPFIPAQEWKALKGASPRPLLSCGAEAVAKTSSRGTQFFAHYRRAETDEHKGESPEHLAVKSAIMNAALPLGWEARPEVAAADRGWIADVLAEKDGRRVAFEVQLASQTAGEYERRQARYEASGIECFWLVRRDDIRLGAVPALQVNVGDEPLTVGTRNMNGQGAPPLERFVQAVLTGNLRWSTSSGTLRATVFWAVHECSSCAQHSVIYAPARHTQFHCTRCEYTDKGPLFSPKSAAPSKAMAAAGLDLPVAVLRGARSFCPACKIPIPPHELYVIEDENRGRVVTTATLSAAAIQPHWCSPGERIFTRHGVIACLVGGRNRDAPALDPVDARRAATLIEEARRRAWGRRKHAEEKEQRAALIARANAERAAARLLEEEQRKKQVEDMELARRQDAAYRKRELKSQRSQWRAEVQALQSRPGTGSHGNPHFRTGAIDAFTTTTLVPVDELLELFPSLEQECVCHQCLSIHSLFHREHRKILWPHRDRGRIDWPDAEL